VVGFTFGFLTDTSELGMGTQVRSVRSWRFPLLLAYVLIEVYYAVAADGGCELIRCRVGHAGAVAAVVDAVMRVRR
jgi:hypothetical protein